MWRATWGAATLTASLCLAHAPEAAAQAQLPVPLELRVPKAPTMVTTSDGRTLVYELHVTNMGAAPVTLRRVEVIRGDSAGATLQAVADSLLTQSIARPGSQLPAAERTRIGPGLRAVVFMWVPGDARLDAPSLVHRVHVAIGDSASRPATLVGPVVPVTRTAVRIAPPLRGGPWLTGNGPSPVIGHRRALISTGGAPTIAQRFAIDYVKLNDSNSTRIGDQLKNESYHAEGEDALAVADGRVVAVKDSIPENVPGVNSRAVPITLETVGGNHVIIDIGNGHYAFYAHLKPGSLRVKVGDRVRRGQVVGLVGNSGNSTEPHLHFHIADSASPLGSEGVPYEYDRYEIIGRCRGIGVGCTRTAPEVRHNDIPVTNLIVTFP